MRISVVVPVYNRADLLPATLDAILSQTRPAIEVIAVDDGSTDESGAVLARYAPRVRAIRIANGGDLVARNVGLRSAVGDLVAFCDSDDLWRPGYLAAARALWDAEPALLFAFANFAVVRDGTWEAREKFSDAPEGFWGGLRQAGADGVFDSPVAERLLRFQPFFPSALIARRDFFLDIGGWDEGVSRLVGCDLATAWRLAEHAPFGVLRAPLVGIRKHASNFSGDVQKMNLGDARVLEHVLATRALAPAHAMAIRASIARRRADALDTAFARGDFEAVRQAYQLLPAAARGPATALKYRVACLPRPVARMAAGALIALRSG